MRREIEPTRGTTARLSRLVPMWAALILAGGAAWAFTTAQGLDMGNGVGSMGMAFPIFVGTWVVMMAAMMLPALGPVAAAETAPASTVSSRPRIPGALAFGAGFLLPWAAYGILAFAALEGTDRLVSSSPQAAKWLGVGILAVAGIYQLSPWKWAALRHCRMPMHRSTGGGLVGAVASGATDGAICVGCCWALMSVLVAVGVMNLLAMAGLAALIFAEKILPRPRLIAVIGGMVFLALAVVAAVHPSLLSGLHVSGPGMPMDMGGM
jgi:predicted metal-binding membrane protein